MGNTWLKIKGIWKNHSIAILITGLLAIGIFMIFIQSASIKKLRNENKILTNNIEVLSDSVKVTYDKYKKAEFSKQSFVVQKPQDLSELNKDLYEELIKIKGDIKSISKLVAEAKSKDTVPIYVTSPSPNIFTFNYDSTYSEGNYLGFNGYIDTQTPSISKLTSRKLGISLVTGLKKVDGRPTIFVKSQFPDLVISSLDGAVISDDYFKSTAQKQRKLSFGLQVGYSPLSYDLSSRKLELKNQITGGIGINIRLK